MGRRRGARGIALFYVMCLFVVMVTLTTAALYRYTSSLRFLSYDSGTVSARLLADSGANLAVVLLRDRSSAWYTDDRFADGITSESLGYTEESLGGRFTLEFKEMDEIYEGVGTYLTVVSTGYSGGRQAQTVATIKVTSPLTNFLTVSNGNFDIGAWGEPNLSGPIFVNANGDEGTLRIWHDILQKDPYRPEIEQHVGGHVKLGVQMKAVGNIKVSNINYLGSIGKGLPLEGEYDTGSILTNNDLPVGPKGKVSIIDDSAAQSNVEVNLKIPSTEETLTAFRTRENVETIDVSAYGDGVLAEFIDGKLVISAAKPTTLGKVYDKSVVSEDMNALRNRAAYQYQTSKEEAEKSVRQETLLDDPYFPNGEYPAALQDDYDGDGQVETHGDFYTVGRIKRGEPIAEFTLSDSEFTSVRLVTSNTSYISRDTGAAQGPDLYVRGVVDGKVSLAYDVTDGSLDPKYDKLHTYVLAEHEIPGENLSSISGSAPGIPGGVSYADPRAKTSADSVGPATDDMLYLLSRGTLAGTGSTLQGKSRVFNDAGEEYNYANELRELDTLYSNYFGGGDPKVKESFKIASWNSPKATQHGIYVGNSASRSAARTTANGGALTKTDKVLAAAQWSALPFGIPTYASRPDQRAVAIEAMRNGYAVHTTFPRLLGAMSSLGKKASFSYGESFYDYRFQSLDAESLSVGIGVPTSVVLCTWQRI